MASFCEFLKPSVVAVSHVVTGIWPGEMYHTYLAILTPDSTHSHSLFCNKNNRINFKGSTDDVCLGCGETYVKEAVVAVGTRLKVLIVVQTSLQAQATSRCAK